MATYKQYAIKNIKGNPVAYHCRIDLPNGDKRMWWEDPDGTKGLKGSKRTTSLPFYGTHLLPKWAGKTLVLVEGEKATDALLSRRIAALGTVCGAHTIPTNDILAMLYYRNIIFFPDNDKQGYNHFVKIANKLKGKIFPRIFQWKGEKGADAADWLKVTKPKDVFKVLRRAPLCNPPKIKDKRPSQHTVVPIGNINVRMDDVVSKVVDLHPKGNGVSVAPCPFHNETNPSFTIFLETNKAYCFGCGIFISNPVDFVMQYYNLPYKNAIERLQNGT